MTDADTDGIDPQIAAIIAAAEAVARTLGPGGLEGVYQAALALEFAGRSIPYERDARLAYIYRGTPLGFSRKVEFLCFGQVAVDIQGAEAISSSNVAEIRHALIASGLRRAVLLNFGPHRLAHGVITHTAEPADSWE